MVYNRNSGSPCQGQHAGSHGTSAPWTAVSWSPGREVLCVGGRLVTELGWRRERTESERFRHLPRAAIVLPLALWGKPM